VTLTEHYAGFQNSRSWISKGNIGLPTSSNVSHNSYGHLFQVRQNNSGLSPVSTSERKTRLMFIEPKRSLLQELEQCPLQADLGAVESGFAGESKEHLRRFRLA
jgi:hypothetical protein